MCVYHCVCVCVSVVLIGEIKVEDIYTELLQEPGGGDSSNATVQQRQRGQSLAQSGEDVTMELPYLDSKCLLSFSRLRVWFHAPLALLYARNLVCLQCMCVC